MISKLIHTEALLGGDFLDTESLLIYVIPFGNDSVWINFEPNRISKLIHTEALEGGDFLDNFFMI